MFTDGSLALAPKHVTHVGGKGEYLHDWYAYLEGYSSEFVRSAYRTYLDGAKTVIDPFGGVGTTPLTLGFDGVECLYSELNPAMRAVISAKATVAALPSKKKLSLRDELIKLSADLRAKVSTQEGAPDLTAAYKLAFGASEFFTPEAYETVLRLRGLNDELLRSDPLLGNALQIAVISRLVQCSLLKRAGDVRFKTERELAKGVPDLIESISDQLVLMANDAARCPELRSIPNLQTANAKDLIELNSACADGVITSPPYLNGTNYFRNTKLELWYMRFITGAKCLRQFRDDVVTSGINDVTKAKGRIVLPPVSEVYEALVNEAYDSRIARMVAGYFDEMKLVMEGLSHQLKTGARLCVDIGDSVYAGVHVKTHEILAKVAESAGLNEVETVTLRDRRSYDGTRLTQSLIVLEKRRASNKQPKVRPSATMRRSTFDNSWRLFKENLPHMRHPYSKRNWGNALHSVCSYQGKMKPALAHHLVEAFSRPGDVVLDPFSGSGTIPFEAALGGRKAYGMDIGLLAAAITNAKVMVPSPDAVEAIIVVLEKHIATSKPSNKSVDDAAAVKFNKSITEYFHDNTFREILCARDFFNADPKPEDAAWSLVFSCMLHILHGNRPYALSRRSHPLTPYAPTGDFEYKSLIEKLSTKVLKSVNTDRGQTFFEGRCYQSDILSEWPDELQNIDAIITSPPFFDSTRFYMTNWMRYWFSGWGRGDFDTQSKLFVEVIQKQSLEVYEPIFKACAERLKRGGLVVFHLGHSDKCDMAEEIRPYAEKHLEVIDVFTETVEHCESHGISDKGRVKGHQYMVLTN